MKFFSAIFLAVMLIICPPDAFAQSAAQKGEAIARAASTSGNGFGDSTAEGEMILYSQAGRQSVRRFVSRSLESRGRDPAANLIVFEWPGDVRNTALLTHAFDEKTDDQWLFLPSIGRVKRISSSARSGSFMGSEFAFEDMVDQGLDEYRHVWERDEACPNGAGRCHVLERIPVRPSGYSRELVWLNQDNYNLHRVQYFDRGGRHIKTLDVTGYRQYRGRFWRPSLLRMQNHLTGKRTDLKWSNFQFGVGLTMQDFSVQRLR